MTVKDFAKHGDISSYNEGLRDGKRQGKQEMAEKACKIIEDMYLINRVADIKAAIRQAAKG